MCATYRACTAVARGSPLKVCCVVPARLHRPCTPAARLQRRTGRSLRHPSCSSAAAMMTEPRGMTTAAARWVRRAGAAGAAIALLSNVAMAATSSSHGKSNNGGCINACHRQWVSDGGACTSRDPACLAAARVKYDACVVACSKPQRTTTTTRPRPTTTTTSLRPTTTTSTTTTTVSTTSVPNPVSTTTTTLKRPTTTTTTLVVGFSQATAACIKVATADKKVCLASASTADCQAEYDTNFASCFAPGKGVACAASCLAKKAKRTHATLGDAANAGAERTASSSGASVQPPAWRPGGRRSIAICCEPSRSRERSVALDPLGFMELSVSLGGTGLVLTTRPEGPCTTMSS